MSGAEFLGATFLFVAMFAAAGFFAVALFVLLMSRD